MSTYSILSVLDIQSITTNYILMYFFSSWRGEGSFYTEYTFDPFDMSKMSNN